VQIRCCGKCFQFLFVLNELIFWLKFKFNSLSAIKYYYSMILIQLPLVRSSIPAQICPSRLLGQQLIEPVHISSGPPATTSIFLLSRMKSQVNQSKSSTLSFQYVYIYPSGTFTSTSYKLNACLESFPRVICLYLIKPSVQGSFNSKQQWFLCKDLSIQSSNGSVFRDF